MHAIYRCENLKTIKFKHLVKEIDRYAFAYNLNLEEIEFESGVEVIRNKAFSYSSKLTSIKINNKTKIFELYRTNNFPIKDIFFEGTLKEFKSIYFGKTLSDEIKQVNVHINDDVYKLGGIFTDIFHEKDVD